MRLRNYFGTDGGTIIKDWYRNQFLPDVKAWRISQDVHNPDGSVTHNYLTGWWYGILALDHIENVIFNDNSIAFVLDRDGNYILKNNIGNVIYDIAAEPIFAGSRYTFGKLPYFLTAQTLSPTPPILTASGLG